VAFIGFIGSLIRKAVQINALSGVRLVCLVYEFNASKHVG
jgi:hypothetical protein